MKKFALLGLAAAIVAVPVSAHRMWLLPSATVLSDTNGWVTVDAAVSNDLFFFDHQPLRLDAIKVQAPDGSEGQVQNPSTGRYRSTFDVKLDKPGTWRIGSFSTGLMGSFKVNGEERRVGRRGPPPAPGGAPGAAPAGPPPVMTADQIPADATDVKLTEAINRLDLFVTAGAPTTTVFKPTGKGIELSPITHPDELVQGEPASFRFLIDGKPASGLKVTVIPGGKRYRNSEDARELTTGADGVVKIDWPTAGMYWINATAEDNKPSVARATTRRMNYVTTVEVLTP